MVFFSEKSMNAVILNFFIGQCFKYSELANLGETIHHFLHLKGYSVTWLFLHCCIRSLDLLRRYCARLRLIQEKGFRPEFALEL